MKVTLVSHTANPEYLAGSAAAICYNGKNPARSLKIAMDGGHESVLEHVSFTFLVEDVSRVLLAQLTRHRLASYSVQSQRYCGVEGCTVITPETVWEHMWHGPFSQAVAECFRLYSQMVAEGVPEEDARYIIPQGVTCQLLVTMNARELRHFFALRCAAATVRNGRSANWRGKCFNCARKPRLPSLRTLAQGVCAVHARKARKAAFQPTPLTGRQFRRNSVSLILQKAKRRLTDHA